MKKLSAVLILFSLFILVGCSETPGGSVRNDKFEGVHGNYEWIETIKFESETDINEGQSHLYHIIRYANTTNKAVMPGEAIYDEMELQYETDTTLNNIDFHGPYNGPPPAEGTPLSDGDIWENENLEIVRNSYSNIKPGITVDFVMETRVSNTMLDLIYLRNKIETATDTVIYEKKISISNP